MGKQIKIFDLLSKKQSLTVFKSQKRKNKLSEQLKEAVAYQKQLMAVLESIKSENTNKTVSQIKSENWYNLKIQDELIAIKNKIDFLTVEVKNQNVQVALAAEKQKKYQNKKKYYYEIDRQEKAIRQEEAMAPTLKNRPET